MPRRGRPPRQLIDAETRRRLMRAGLVVLTEKGYSAAAIDEILYESGVPKGCFYHYFRSKADFGRQLLAEYDAYFTAKLSRWFDDVGLTPLARLRGFVADAEQGVVRHDFRRGCLVGNLGQEVGTLPDDYRARLVGILAGWQDRTAVCLRMAQEAGEVPRRHDAATLATFFWVGWEGAVLRAKLERSTSPLVAFSQTFFEFITS
jgi:TetR/AcrR family transcriptional repressor of nem operon